MRILFIQSNPDAEWRLRRALKNAAAQLTFRASGREGLLEARTQFDLIICDTDLYDCDGFELMALIRKETPNEKSIIVMTNDYFNLEMVQLADSLGAMALIKPYQLELRIESIVNELKEIHA